VYSGIAYSTAKGVSLDWCKSIERGLPRPDVILFFDVPVSVVSQRSHFGVNDRHEKIEFLECVSHAYKDALHCEELRMLRYADSTIDAIAKQVAMEVAEAFNSVRLDKAVDRLFPVEEEEEDDATSVDAAAGGDDDDDDNDKS